MVGWGELVEQERLLIVAPVHGVTSDTVRIGAPLSVSWVVDNGVHLPVLRLESDR